MFFKTSQSVWFKHVSYPICSTKLT